MTDEIVTAVLLACAFYLALGAAVGVWVFARGLASLDATAAAAPIYVKALWAPGVAALWPLLILRALKPPPEDQA